MAVKNFFIGLAIAIVGTAAITAGLFLETPSSLNTTSETGSSAHAAR